MSTPELKIVSGGTEVLLVNHVFGVYRQRYVPATPSEADRDVSESAEVLVTGFTTGITFEQGLNRLFQKARDYTATKIGDPVYVQYRLNDSDPWWRSELRDGRCELPGRTLGSHKRGDLLQCQVLWTRQPFWESTSLTNVQMTNGNGINQSSLVLDNDGNHYATITSNQILGDLPTPAKISITNDDAAALGVIRIGHGYIPSIAQAWQIQGESAGSGTASGTSSGGEYKALSVTTGEATLVNLTLSSSLLDNAKRGYFRLMARFTGNPTGAVRLKVQLLYGSNVLAQGKWVRTTANQEWLDLGDVQLPPYESGGNSVALTLRLLGKADSNTTVNLDYIACVPLDSWRILVPLNTGLLSGNTVVDDGPAGRLYELVGGDQVTTFADYGAPIMLHPNTAQKIMILQAGANGSAAIDKEITLSVGYRKRVVTL